MGDTTPPATSNHNLDAYIAQLLCVAVCAEARLPLLIVGPPGIGKSSLLQQFTEGRQRHLEVVVASIREPSDYGGLPLIVGNGETGEVVWAPPRWVKRATEPGTDVFHDEMNGATPATANAMLRGLLDRELGDTKMHDDTWQFGAMNDIEHAASGWELYPAMANRWVHLNWEEGINAHVMAYGFRHGWPEVPSVHFATGPDNDALNEARADIKNKIAAFVEATGEEFHHAVPDDPNQAARAWPSWRTWDYVADVCAYLDVSDIEPKYRQVVRNRLVCGCVGQPAGFAFLEWESTHDLPNPETVIADPFAWHPPTDDDALYTTVSAVIDRLRLHQTEERWIAVGDILGKVAETGRQDIAAAKGRDWAELRPASGTPVFSDYAAEHLMPILIEIGLITSADTP